MNNKRFLRIAIVCAVIIIIGVLLFLPYIMPKADEGKIKIISTNFPSYDVARALTFGQDVNLKMLIKPGTDLHDYDPTPQDIAAIQSADIFIYIGGESEAWVDEITFSDQTLVIKLLDAVHTKIKESDDEIDEHIWTSPSNYLNMLSYAKGLLAAKYPDLASAFANNLSTYGEEIHELSQKFSQANITQPIVMADRFPFNYFVKGYNLSYLAAFPGCAEQTEASADTIAELINTVKQKNVSYIYTLEMSNTKIAQTVAEATGAKIRTLYSGHNLSQEDYKNGVTMATIYERNLKTLQETE